MEEQLYYNAIAIALEGDYRRIAKLKKNFPDWKSAYDGLRSEGRAPPDIYAEQKKLEAGGIRLVLFGDEAYPALLREIHDPPFGIYILGTLANADFGKSIAIVGTRRGTPEGRSIAKRFARELADAGCPIVSGLALGIDAAAHEGCLETAQGITLAILAGGLDAIYPATNEHLARKILERGGGIISEYPFGSPPLPYRFLERNRIVSGLTKGVLVVECPDGSGSLATARFALEQNRDVFVVPGPISHPNFFGSHSLIRQGAELVTKPEEIFEAYGLGIADKVARAELAASDEEKQVLVALRSTSAAMNIDKIIAMTKLEPRIVSRAITFLETKNLVRETNHGYIIEG